MTMEDFVSSLLGRMTLEEKLGQLNLVTRDYFTQDQIQTGAVLSTGAEDKIRKGLVGGMLGLFEPDRVRKAQAVAVRESRLKIPLLLGLDVIHGHKTLFPIPLALSCTWDMGLIERTARLAAIEAAADGVHWVYSPMVDIARDPRWGRIAEGAGEDPHLGAEIARAMVRGYQGTDLRHPESVMACVKHFALYGAAEGGRDYNTCDMSRLRMYETYFPPYRAAVEAGAGSVMSAFNDVEGVPATGNRWLLTDVLRNEWGFSGFVVSDYTSVNEMTQHGLGDLKTVSALALKAGLDMDMVGEGFVTTLKQSLDEGAVSAEEIERACRRVLEAKYRLGLFDDPLRGLDAKNTPEIILCPEHRAAAREAAARSCVLLGNAGGALPLKKTGTIALVGPLAHNRKNMLGMWSVAGDWQTAVTVLEGVKSAAQGATVLHAAGSNIVTDPVLIPKLNIWSQGVELDPRAPEEMLKEAVETARKSDVVVAVVGEAQDMSGEASTRADIGIPEDQRRLLEELKKTGKPLVLVIFSGRPLTLAWEKKNADAILFAWCGGTEGGNGVADVLFGDVNPSAKLTTSFPWHVGQVPVYHAHKSTGRPFEGTFTDGGDFATKFKSRYLDVPNEPLFPFGFGLSYTTFAYGPVTLDKAEAKGDVTLQASVTVANTGAVAGDEIVQLYISDPVASVARAVMDLKGFQRVSLASKETAEVVFDITTEHLKFYDSALQHVWEAGEFVIHVGPNAAELQSARVFWRK